MCAAQAPPNKKPRMDDSPSSPVKERQPGIHEVEIVEFTTAVNNQSIVIQESIGAMWNMINNFNFVVNEKKWLEDQAMSLEVMQNRQDCLKKLEGMGGHLQKFCTSYNNFIEGIRYFDQTQLEGVPQNGSDVDFEPRTEAVKPERKPLLKKQKKNKPVVRDLIN